MRYGRFVFAVAIFGLTFAPLASEAASRERAGFLSRVKTQAAEMTRQRKPVNSQAALRQRGQEHRLVRVHGVVRGMTNKLANLSDRLDKQLAAIERRLLVLENDGHELHVDAEFATLSETVAKTKSETVAIAETLNSLSDADDPKDAMQQVRAQMRTLRSTFKDMHTAFVALQMAVNRDLHEDNS